MTAALQGTEKVVLSIRESLGRRSGPKPRVEAVGVRLCPHHALITLPLRLMFTVWLEAVATSRRPRKEEQKMVIPRCEAFSCIVAAAAKKENGPRADGIRQENK